jgi:uncharacterized lipoprotein YmbA
VQYLAFILLLLLLGCGSGTPGLNFTSLSILVQEQFMKCAGDPKCQEAVVKAAEAAYKQVSK